jgi:hypothetical protein
MFLVLLTQTQNSHNSLNGEFKIQFKVGKTFSDRKELNNVVTTFGKKNSFSFTPSKILIQKEDLLTFINKVELSETSRRTCMIYYSVK